MIGLDLGLQTLSISQLSRDNAISKKNFNCTLIEIIWLYKRLTALGLIILLIILGLFYEKILGVYSIDEIIAIIVHVITSSILLGTQYVDSALIALDKLLILRKSQIIGFVAMFVTFLIGYFFVQPILLFVISNSAYVLVYRGINFWKYFRTIAHYQVLSYGFKKKIVIKDFFKIVPASFSAVVLSRYIYLVAITSLGEGYAALFVTTMSILSVTGFISQVYFQSKAFELTKKMVESKLETFVSIIWHIVTYIVSFLFLHIFIDLIGTFRPEISKINIGVIRLLYIYSCLDGLVGILGLVLLNNDIYRYLKVFSFISLVTIGAIHYMILSEKLTLIILLYFLIFSYILYFTYLLTSYFTNYNSQRRFERAI
jgi:hypothetical protein